MTGVLNVRDHSVNGLEGIVQGRLVVEPPKMSVRPANVQAVHAAWKRVDVDNHMHPILADRVWSDIVQERNLAFRIELGPGASTHAA